MRLTEEQKIAAVKADKSIKLMFVSGALAIAGAGLGFVTGTFDVNGKWLTSGDMNSIIATILICILFVYSIVQFMIYNRIKSDYEWDFISGASLDEKVSFGKIIQDNDLKSKTIIPELIISVLVFLGAGFFILPTADIQMPEFNLSDIKFSDEDDMDEDVDYLFDDDDSLFFEDDDEALDSDLKDIFEQLEADGFAVDSYTGDNSGETMSYMSFSYSEVLDYDKMVSLSFDEDNYLLSISYNYGFEEFPSKPEDFAEADKVFGTLNDELRELEDKGLISTYGALDFYTMDNRFVKDCFNEGYIENGKITGDGYIFKTLESNEDFSVSYGFDDFSDKPIASIYIYFEY